MTQIHTFSIRQIEERDFDALLDLFETVAAERTWIGTEPGFDRNAYRAGFRSQMRGDWGSAFVAVAEGRPVGFIGTRPHGDYGYVFGMMVLPQWRGCGVGSALLERELDWARAAGLPEMSLLVFSHNERAIALYRKHGFEVREFYPKDVTRQTGEVWDTILMTKRL